jgi:type I restriction enzyme S subunit
MSLPEGWCTVDLLSIASISTGKVDANHACKQGKYLFFTCAIEPLQSRTYSFDGDAIILPGNGANVGHVSFYSGKFEAYQRTYVLYDFLIISRYLFYQLTFRWKSYNTYRQYGSATIPLAN